MATVRRAARAAIALALTAALGALASLVIVPPRSMAMLAGSVAATEYSPVLALACLIVAPAAWRLLDGRRALRLACTVLLLASAAVCCWPLTRFAGVARGAQEQLGGGDAARWSPLGTFRRTPLRGPVHERDIGWAAADGTPLTMRLLHGDRPGPRPTVVVIYGGAWRGGSPTQGLDMSRALASRGFTVAAIAYRHAPRARHPAQLHDVRRALALLRDSAAAWRVDTARIALFGRSAGGHLAELAAWAPGAPPVRAVVAVYAPFDLVQGYWDLPDPDPIGVRAVLRDFVGGTPDDDPERWREASPSHWVRAGLPPVLLLYGARDHVVKPSFNRTAAARLRAANVPVVAVEIPWAEHGYDMAPGGLGAQLVMHLTAAFLERELR